MYCGLPIDPPFFEFGPKAYMYGEELVLFAKHAEQISRKYRVQIIITPQYVDIPLLAKEIENILVFAQHMDSIPIGRGVGSVLPEALKAAGASGVLLNHSEKPLLLDEIERAIKRADEVGLASMVCADTLENVELIARLNPNILLAEAPELIGTGMREESDQQVIPKINQVVWEINPEIRVLHGAGISNGRDVYEIISLGAQGTGSTSGIIKAPDPLKMMDEMIASVRSAWDATH